MVHEIAKLLQETFDCISGDHAETGAIKAFRQSIEHIDLDAAIRNLPAGNIPEHYQLLGSAISQIDDQFDGLRDALMASKDALCWQVDAGTYYSAGAEVGEAYQTGNMHTVLVGPNDAVISSDTFLLGLFLLAPRTLYRDHKHAAPEIYVPLTGPTGWRFDKHSWEDHPAGSVIVNPPHHVHATRVYDVPFLAIFAWTQDIGSGCEVVEAADWLQIERYLRSIP